jgi:hypothetical protein
MINQIVASELSVFGMKGDLPLLIFHFGVNGHAKGVPGQVLPGDAA